MSIPVIAGMLCFLSQSPSDFFAFQCEKFSEYSETISPFMWMSFDSNLFANPSSSLHSPGTP